MEWVLVKKNIRDLKPHPRNPRKLSKHDYEHLQKSLDKFGLIDKPIINTDGTIIGGHQRVAVLKKSGVKEVDCWMPKATLSEKEIDELNIRLNRATGEWEWDTLANEWEIDDLLEWGFSEKDLNCDIKDIQSPEIDLPISEPEFTAISFTLTCEQKNIVMEAIDAAKKLGDFVDTGNENSNGNAISRICELWRAPKTL